MSTQEKQNTIEVLLVKPGKKAEIISMGCDLKSMQQTVEGYIQSLYFTHDPVVIVCNDEGKLNGLPLNRAIFDEKGKMTDIIAGTFFVCGINEDNFASLPQAYQTKYEAMFREPQGFVKMGKEIIAIPLETMKPKSQNKQNHSDMDR